MLFHSKNYLLIGVLALLLGIQLQLIDSIILSEGTTRALASVSKSEQVAARASVTSLLMTVHPEPRKKITPPDWAGLATMTAGLLMCAHAISIRRR